MQPVKNSEDVGKLIRRRRKDVGLTITQLSEMLGCSTRFLSEIERGKEGAGIERVLKIAAALGLELRMGKKSN